MPFQARSQQGQFAAKSDESREVRSLRCTDATWQKLGELAESQGITRADLIERWVAAPAPLSSATILEQVDEGITRVLSDPTVTRNGKDRGSVRRALEALREYLSSPRNTR
jgi:hypothetical protein